MQYTTKDLDEMTRDDRWGGWGYLGERERMDPEFRARVDGILLEAAAIGDWTHEELFQFVNSRPGRHFADEATYVETSLLVKRYLARKHIDALMASLPPVHTVRGKTSAEGWAYGVTHDMDCPGCKNTPFTASPRSETYWAS